MIDNRLEKLLTPSAERALNEAVEDYRQKLVKKAVSFAIINHSDKEISLNNILKAIETYKINIGISGQKELDYVRNNYKKDELKTDKFRNLVSFSMFCLGILYVIFGVFYNFKSVSLLQENIFNENNPQTTIILCGILLIIVSVLFRFFYLKQKKREQERVNKSTKMDNLILSLWSYIDYYGNYFMMLYKDYLATIDLTPNENINSSIDLINQILNSPVERNILAEFLDVRNIIVHGKSDDIDIGKKEKVIDNAYDIIEKLASIENEKSTADVIKLIIDKIHANECANHS